MTIEKLYNDLSLGSISLEDAYKEITSKANMKKINYYVNIDKITSEPLSDIQLQELGAIVGILQIIETSELGSPIDDERYDTLQEMLVNMGVPRLTGSIELNQNNKVSHKYTILRGTLDKVYYLYPTEKRTNKSRKYLDEWIKKIEALYRSKTGKEIDLNKVKIMLQPKFDGASAVLQIDDKILWITRGDTRNNKASDITHIMNIFNDQYIDHGKGSGIKFEVMCPEENKDKINELYRQQRRYRNSRQVVTATLNSNEPDFKVEYLHPVPLRIAYDHDKVEHIHPDLIKRFPTEICTFGDRDIIKKFADNNRYVVVDGLRFRTDGVVMTILDDDLKIILGRDDNINNFEIAYKFTEEVAYSKVKDVEFYISDFGYITPVLVINDVIMKGNTINRISLSNKERFNELNLSYGDEVKILYDIIPYAIIDDKCKRIPNGRKIEFAKKCPSCKSDLDLNTIMVKCSNPNCPSRQVGRILNYCTNLRIQNIGYSTLASLYEVGLLDNGISDLYKLKKKTNQITDLEGFGKSKTKKIITEIESRRKLNDFDFFGSLGIDGLSIKTFESIFAKIKLSDLMNMIKVKNYDLIYAKLINVNDIGHLKANKFIEYLKDQNRQSELKRLLKEVTLYETYGSFDAKNGRVVFTGCRPSDEVSRLLRDNGYEPSSSWSASKTKYVVTTDANFESGTTNKAKEAGIPIVTLDNRNMIDVIQSSIINVK